MSDELGQGGMATVYLAHDLRHKRNVALKVLKPEFAAVLGADRPNSDKCAKKPSRPPPPLRTLSLSGISRCSGFRAVRDFALFGISRRLGFRAVQSFCAVSKGLTCSCSVATFLLDFQWKL